MEPNHGDPDLSVGGVVCTYLDDDCPRGRDEGIVTKKITALEK